MTSIDGTVFTLKPPAVMSREISELADSEGLFRFKITSLILMNPDNKPDAFEKESLEMFAAKGSRESFQYTETDDGSFFKYMSPLYVVKPLKSISC